ncbi:response regulator receiver domain-containing protein [Neolewinella xylanilytica]|uniref:Response regulator receiver domain-containing protein n=1 Tax=Neolewinella xylanilytica TaxID=1514080 RepID=A0A2S6I933_9BACT|nr:response regulator [Neolewinella xylanilytica]PPK88006.1 response regulator receiver domain-containing protein [Neolewinella xylanilytica]
MYANQILLAEDDSTDAEFFQRALRRLDSPPELVWCKNGLEALEGLSDVTNSKLLPRLAILDIKMPGMSGLELLAKLKSDERTKNLPVIIMSSSDEPQDIAMAYDYGANGYLVKPNRFQDLRELVNSINSFWIKTNRLRPMVM